ncbi:MAG: response regulator [Anaerolineaceae bacterium]|nr:response regulator [Anaerolineaceae bacterium]
MSQVKILVIDDDAGMTDMLSMLLASASPEIIVANSGKAGIELARKHKPNIILLDLMMPEMSGWAVCKMIREFSDAPILILTSIDSSGVIAQAFDAGADDYLVKPVSGGILIAHINNLIRRSKITLQSSLAEGK